MRGRTNRLAIAVLLTLVDVAVGKYYCGVIWQAFSQDLFARAALLGLLCLWILSAAVLWLHVAYDLRQTLRERDGRLAFSATTIPAEPERDTNV
jgi:membrane protein YdbS with pleckstrin-like domain